jgi:hypothetical protein
VSDKYYLKILHFGYKNNQRFMALVVLLLSDHHDLKVVRGGCSGDPLHEGYALKGFFIYLSFDFFCIPLVAYQYRI